MDKIKKYFSKFKKGNLTIAITCGIICVVLIALMFIQFRTVDKTKEADIENMRETELRTQISTYKSKYEEALQKLQDTEAKITEYEQKAEQNQEASQLLEKELIQSDMLVGKTDVIGDGVVVTLKDTQEYKITSVDLLDLLNELKYAGAEAISINEQRIINLTDIADIWAAGYITINGDTRIVSPYVVKAIGDQTYLTSTLNLKDSGYIDQMKNSGKDVQMAKQNKIKILAYSDEINNKYMKEVD